MTIFTRGSTRVHRSVRLVNQTGTAITVPLPAGAKVTRIHARNKGTVAFNLSAGNVVSGAQYLAATAVPVASSATDVTTAGIISEAAISVAVSIVASTLYLTLSAAPGAPGADIVIDYLETLESLPAPTVNNPVAY